MVDERQYLCTRDMKTTFRKYIALIMLAIIAVTSVAQFHHHCCEGEIYIHLTNIGDIVIGGNNIIDDCHHETHSPTHHHHSDGHDADSCSMHISEFYADNDKDLSIDISDCIVPSTFILKTEEVKATVKFHNPTSYLTAITKRASGMRAPPVLC